MLFFAHQPQYSVIFVGRKLGRFGVPGFCVVCLLCLSTRPWGGPPRSGASQGLGIGNIMLVMQGKPNFQRITGVTSRSRRQTWVLERAEKHPHDHDTRDNFFQRPRTGADYCAIIFFSTTTHRINANKDVLESP